MSPPAADFVVLGLNSGSSSLKIALYAFWNGKPERLAWGEAEELGHRSGSVWLRGNPQIAIQQKHEFKSAGEAARFLIAAMSKGNLPAPNAVGHRIVHGGPHLREHQKITPTVFDQLKQAVAFAPLHLPSALEVIAESRRQFPDLPQIACFDTAFHRTIPEYAVRLPFGREFWDRGLRRYGFHGLVCESVVRTLGDELSPRTVIAHLGNGCSLTALQNGKSIETTMGLTPTGGVMMGTRTGDLDPGVLLNLLTSGNDASQLDALVNHQSGLVGVSEKSSDMRELLEARSQDPKVDLAIKMFCYSIRKSIGALAAVLGGIDMLAFSGGIGEHAPAIKGEICAGLEYLGIALDDSVNVKNAQQIGRRGAKCDVRIVVADEDLEIAMHSWSLARLGSTA